MVGYQLKNTLTENGSVARGVCEIDGAGKLVKMCIRDRDSFSISMRPVPSLIKKISVK